MDIGLIVVGDEILSGKRADKHLPKFVELLAERGLSLAWAAYVGDERERLTATLGRAFAGGDLVVCCGGIGATPDDHTRQAAAAALGRELVLHPGARALIWQRIQQLAAEQGQEADAEQPDNLRRFEMGRFPAGAELLPNPYNQIPGFRVGSVFFLPGFPVMAHPMMAWLLDLPEQAGLLPRLGPGPRELSLIVSGAMEAALTPLMERIEVRFPDVRVFSLPSVAHPAWGRHIELGVKRARPEAGTDSLQQAYAELRAEILQFGASVRTELVR